LKRRQIKAHKRPLGFLENTMTLSNTATQPLAPDRQASQVAILFSGIGHFYAHLFPMLYFTIILGLQTEFPMTHGELTALATIGVALYGLAALPAGWLGDRWSSIGMMVVFFIGVGASAVLTSFADSPFTLTLGLSAIGLFGAIYHPVGIAWLVANAEKKGIALGLNGIFGAAGMAFASLIASGLMEGFSWRAAFMVPGLLSIITGLVLAFAWRKDWVRDAHSDRSKAPEAKKNEGTRVLLILAFTLLCGGFIHQALAAFIPKLFTLRTTTEVWSDNGTTDIAFIVTVVYGMAALANFVGGWLSDRYDLKWVYIACLGLLSPALFFAASSIEFPLVGFITLALFVQIGSLPAENIMIAHHTQPQWRGLVFGAKFVLGFGLASLALPVTGYMFDRDGHYINTLLMMAILAVLPFAAAFFLPSQEKQAQKQQV